MTYYYFDEYLGPNMIKFLIFHCFYHHHFNVPSWWFHEILNITLLLPLLFEWRFYGANSCSYEIVNISLVLPSSLDGLAYDLYEILWEQRSLSIIAPTAARALPEHNHRSHCSQSAPRAQSSLPLQPERSQSTSAGGGWNRCPPLKLQWEWLFL